MSKQILIPDIGSDEVNVTEILVNVGDTIVLDQSLIVVEGDKASMEIPASESGIIKEILVKVGDKVSTGSAFLVLDTAEQVSPETVKKETVIEEKQVSENLDSSVSATSQFPIPDIGNDEVSVTEILVAIGDKVELEQSLFTIEGDKASMEVPSPIAGLVKEILLKVGDKVVTGTPMIIIEHKLASEQVSAEKTETAIPAAVLPASETPSPQAQKEMSEDDTKLERKTDPSASYKFFHATPVIRRLAREFGVDLDLVSPTGPKGRILKEDVQNYVKNLVSKVVNPSASSLGSGVNILPWPKVDFSKFGEIEISPLSKIQKISGANLHRNWVMIPHITQWDKTDITEMEAFRKEQNVLAEKQKQDVKYTPLVFLMKAVAKAMEDMPKFNSSLSEDGESLILKKYINIGIAVDTPNGLVVPVIKDVNKKGLKELSQELAVYSKKAREGKLTTSDMQGGCFTISSLGGIGGTHFSPIVNAPEVAILGVSKSSIEPIWNGKEFTPRLMLPLSLSYDHRVIDGADGARFVTLLSGILADIRRLIL